MQIYGEKPVTKCDVSDFFDGYAHDFDGILRKRTFWNTLVNKYLRKSIGLRYAKTIDGCYPIEGKNVIDIGCGPGYYGIALAKRGAKFTCGVDFSKGMIELAKQNAIKFGVEDKCSFILADFMKLEIKGRFDYSIAMGFMDYAREPEEVIEKVLRITKKRAFFSFPVDGGVLAWQRKLRYRKRCELFMYRPEQLRYLFSGCQAKKVEIGKISRDFFVEVLV